MLNRIKNYFTAGEWVLWFASCTAIIISFFMFSNGALLTLVASLIGVTSLIFNAKGNFLGPLLIIVFGFIYGYVSYGYAYYGEMITYLGMTSPMALLALVSWFKNPFDKRNKMQVKVNSVKRAEAVFMLVLTAAVTAGFYFILRLLSTNNLFFSTLSVATSFSAAYLTFRRSPYYALAYALNDIVLIVLWVLASFENASYISVVVCFAVFLVNDLYGFFSWKKMRKAQKEKTLTEG